MYTGLIISGLLLLTALFIFKLLNQGFVLKENKQDEYSSIPALTNIQPALMPDIWNSFTATSNANLIVDYGWWKALANLDQLHLALMLCQKALPVWDTYAASLDIVYKNSPTSPVSTIHYQLLAKVMDEVALQSRQLFPDSNNSKIKQYYYHFVGPVIALQDGNWAPPYPVKKVFLSVYNILKSIIEQDNTSAIENSLAIAINQSLDCMDITKLYSKVEINGYLQVYKDRL